MFDIHRVALDWGGRTLTLETGKIARQADGAVVATYGETSVLATVVAAKKPKEGIDFLPLTVNYQEKFYAAGRIPGGYFKREGRPSERETLISRLIDRPVRPLFADGWRCDTQVIINVLSHDLENDPDIVAMVAASAALTLSGAPFMGPIGGARVAFINNEFVLNPQIDEMQESQLDLVVAGTQDAVLMVEFGSQGAVRGDHAGRRNVRPQAFPAGHQRDHRARREGRQGAARGCERRQFRARARNSRPHRAGSARRLCGRRQSRALCSGRCRQTKGDDAFLPGGRGREAALRRASGLRRVQGARGQDRAQQHPRYRPADRRARREDRTPDRERSRPVAAHSRLSAVHPRRDPGTGGGDARHRRGRAVHRRAAGYLQGDVPAALQFPAVLGRRDRPHRRTRPPRSRTRQACVAGAASGATAAPRVSLYDPRRFRDHRVRTARPRWQRCAEARSP